MTVSNYIYNVGHTRWPAAGGIIGGIIEVISRRDIFTIVRVLACAFLFWAFLSGGSLLPLRGPVVLAVAMALGMLTAYEMFLRDVSPGWVLGGVLSIQAGIGGG